jgi:hypothetical protein
MSKFTFLSITLGLLITISFNGHAKSHQSFCFQGHIKESIAINKNRKKIYSKLTQGKSNRIFNELITYERLTLLPAAIYDLKALKYQKKGMDLFCKEFLPLVQTPVPEIKIPQETFSLFDWKFHKKKIVQALNTQNAKIVKEVTLEALVELKSQPNYYCLTRHFIESIYRFAHFVPLRRSEAAARGLKDPAKFMFSLMRIQALGLMGSIGIDLKSQPIQESGIPMICAEMPSLLSDINNIELDVLKNK